MKAAVWKSKDILKIEEMPVPDIGNGEVLIKVAYAGICGSDFTILHGKHITAKPPLIMGHEFSGTIAKSRSNFFKEGDRVVVEPLVSCGHCRPCMEGNYHVCKNLKLLGVGKNGAFAEYVKAGEDKTFKIPDDISLLEASMIEPLSVAIHAIDASRIKIGSSVLISGAGPIGALVCMLAKKCGAGKVIVSELSEFRLKNAEKSGAIPFNADKNEDLSKFIKDITGENGADLVFECAGTEDSVRSCLENIGILGKLIQVGIPKKPVETDYRNFIYKEQEIIGIRVYRQGTFKRAIDLLADKKIILKDLASDIFSLDDIEKAFECADNKNRSLKVLIKL